MTPGQSTARVEEELALLGDDDPGEYEYEEVEEEVEEVVPDPQSAAEITTGLPIHTGPTPTNVKAVIAEVKARKGLPVDKNPFVVTGVWTPELLNEVDIVCPSLTSADETTNELTRANKPEARYWKSPIKFSAGNGKWTSGTLRFNNVPIPYRETKGYGSSFVYLCLPGFVASAFASAGKKIRPTVVYEPSLVPDNERWWKVVNNVSDNFGVVVRGQSRTEFISKPLDVIMNSSKLGVTANLELKFLFKASTSDKSLLSPASQATVAVELVRAYLTDVGVDVQQPVRVPRVKAHANPTPINKDLATDGMLEKLGRMGL